VVVPSGSYTNQKQPFRAPQATPLHANRASQEPFSLRAAFLERNFNRPPYRQCTALNGDG